jgi:DNA-binding FadR family transcriptional regulator
VERGEYTTVRIEARRMDVALVAATGNREMERYMRDISNLLLHAATQALDSSDEYQEAMREHGEILNAVRTRGADRAREATKAHFDGILRRLSGYRG